jgi:flagellar basal-body rod modification protein FlgD
MDMSAIQTNTVDPTLLANVNGNRNTAKTTTEEAQDRFLTLLVTQMKNQDPLNPMDNAAVTSQLAQLSTVTGIEKLNASVTAMSANFQSAQNLQAANMIGHGVIAPGSTIGLKDGKAIFGVELPQAADRVDLIIKDASGVTIRTMNVGVVPAGVNTMTWDGKTDVGTAAPNGVYSFSVNANSGDKKLDAINLSFGIVSSITSTPQGVRLSVDSGSDIAMSEVRQIY